MARPDLVPFGDEHVDPAAELLAGRHRAQRAVEPLLPARYEAVDACREEVAALWATDGASGAVAIVDGRVAGYLLGAHRAGPMWGANLWVELAGFATTDPELSRDLYGAAAGRWVDEGHTRHYVLVPATDRAVVDAWFHVGFGLQHVHAVREVPADVVTRDRDDLQIGQAEERDIDELVELDPLLPVHQTRSPVFSGLDEPDDPEAVRADIVEDLANPEVGTLVAEIGDRIVGNFVVVPVEMSSTHSALARPDGAALLGWAATRPEVRGDGVGLALTDATLRWARERGYEVMVTDWRATNLLSSRFWPRRGFRPTFYRLYRSIP